MMRMLSFGLVAAVAWAGYNGLETPSGPAADPAPQQAARVLEWRVASGEQFAGADCRIALSGDGGTFSVSMPANCPDFPESLARASVWREDRRGSVVLEDASGERIAEFGPAEFEGLVSVYPRHVDLALLPAD